MADTAEDKANTPEPNEELVKVFDTEQESEAFVVRGLLESEGIPSILENLDAPQDVLPGVGGVIVLVRAEHADTARALIEASRSNPIDDDTAVTEEPV